MLEGRLDPTHGALVHVRLQPPDYIARDPSLSGDPSVGVPRSRDGWAILDTGASMSCVVERVARELDLLHVDAIAFEVVRPGGERAQRAFSKVRHGLLELLGTGRRASLQMVEVSSLGRCDQGPIIALIGRDYLGGAVLTWDGPAGRFALRWPGQGSPSCATS